jgi:hypothetical protein
MEFFNRKDVWTYVIKYLEISDVLNLELSCKIIQSGILNYYLKQTESFPKENKKFNAKKEYLKKYMNACVVCNISSEYDTDKVFKNNSQSEGSPEQINEDSAFKLRDMTDMSKRLFSQE